MASFPEIVINMPINAHMEVVNRKKSYALKHKIPLVWFIEPKDEYKLRAGGKSPDQADALVMAILAYFRRGGIKFFSV